MVSEYATKVQFFLATRKLPFITNQQFFNETVLILRFPGFEGELMSSGWWSSETTHRIAALTHAEMF